MPFVWPAPYRADPAWCGPLAPLEVTPGGVTRGNKMLYHYEIEIRVGAYLLIAALLLVNLGLAVVL